MSSPATNGPDEAENAVRGERDSTVIGRPPSLQSRAGSVLAVTLMSVLGLGMLTWYYANAMTRQVRARQTAQSVSAKRAQGDMPLPSLGKIDQPVLAPPTVVAPEESRSTGVPELLPSPRMDHRRPRRRLS
jgi:type IV secretion system protein VirB10